jgi:sodium-type flagellar protein MotY
VRLFAGAKRSEMRKTFLYWPGLTALIWSVPVPATTYMASLEAAAWQVQPSKLSCRLRQSIPNYGDAVFEAQAGGAQHFYLEPKKNPMQSGRAELVAAAPFWNPDLQPVALGPVEVVEGRRPVQLGDDQTRQLLRSLGAGLAPELTRPARTDAELSVRVGLSPVRFRRAYEKFEDCVAGLPKVTVAQLTTTVVEFGLQQTELSAAARSKLDLLMQYARESGRTAVAIDTLSVDTPRRLENLRLARDRAEAVSNYLVSRGIAARNIASSYRGERGARRPGVVTVRLRQSATAAAQ